MNNVQKTLFSFAAAASITACQPTPVTTEAPLAPPVEITADVALQMAQQGLIVSADAMVDCTRSYETKEMPPFDQRITGYQYEGTAPSIACMFDGTPETPSPGTFSYGLRFASVSAMVVRNTNQQMALNWTEFSSDSVEVYQLANMDGAENNIYLLSSDGSWQVGQYSDGRIHTEVTPIRTEEVPGAVRAQALEVARFRTLLLK